MREYKYWLVYAPDKYKQSTPTTRHETYEQAKKEAIRLAQNNIGHNYFVLETIDCFQAVLPQPQSIELIEKE